MPSIYPQLKYSDRKFIRTEKARIRRQFLDTKKQEELITELYQRILGKKVVLPKEGKMLDIKEATPVSAKKTVKKEAKAKKVTTKK